MLDFPPSRKLKVLIVLITNYNVQVREWLLIYHSLVGKVGASPPSHTTGPIFLSLSIYISFNRVSGYRNVSTCFFFIVTFRHFMGHNDMSGSVTGSQALHNDREGVMLPQTAEHD